MYYKYYFVYLSLILRKIDDTDNDPLFVKNAVIPYLCFSFIEKDLYSNDPQFLVYDSGHFACYVSTGTSQRLVAEGTLITLTLWVLIILLISWQYNTKVKN